MERQPQSGPKPFTGKHMTAIMVGAFGLIVAVNLAMASVATSTFGGVVVENSYVASQEFNRWLDQAEESRALGWKATPRRLADGRVELFLEGVPAGTVALAQARHPLGREADRMLAFMPASGNRYVSSSPLPEGRWTLRIKLEAEGREWRGEADLR